jgi:hypothetical protein
VGRNVPKTKARSASFGKEDSMIAEFTFADVVLDRIIVRALSAFENRSQDVRTGR